MELISLNDKLIIPINHDNCSAVNCGSSRKLFTDTKYQTGVLDASDWTRIANSGDIS